MSRIADPFRRLPMVDVPNHAGFKLWAFTKSTGVAVEATVIRDADGAHRLDVGSVTLFSGWRPREDQDDHRRRNFITISTSSPLLTAAEMLSKTAPK